MNHYYAYHGDTRGNHIQPNYPKDPNTVTVTLSEEPDQLWAFNIEGPDLETVYNRLLAEHTYLHTIIQELAYVLANTTGCRCGFKRCFNVIAKEIAETGILPNCPDNCHTCQGIQDAWNTAWETRL